MSRKTRQKLKRKAKAKGFKPVVQYKDKSGKKRFHGTKHLTDTQKLGCTQL